MKFKFTTEMKEILEHITENFAQKSSPNDRMLDLDPEISIFGDELEKRNQFARDRDRIIYSTAFRRLEHKAQVYSHEKGDHYRTRLTHTLEVMQIARGIARNLGLNEDLTEAIALGHDIGHTPFGHAGEEILDKIMRGKEDLGGKIRYNINYGGFKHNFHSLKILDVIESKYDDEDGLNLTWQVLEGILKHTKIKKNEKNWDYSRFVKNEQFFEPLIPSSCNPKNPINSIDPEIYSILKSSLIGLENIISEDSLTLEGQIVNIADEIAQRQHDLDDGLRDIDLQLKDNDILDYLTKIIENIIDEIFDEIIEKKYSPLETFLVPKKLIIPTNFTLNFNINSNSHPFFPKVSGLKLTEYYKKIILEDENLDDEFKLLIKLNNRLKSGKRNKCKWKNIIRDINSYFIHDVTLNTIKNILEEDSLIYSDNLYFRKENNEFKIAKFNIKNENCLLIDYKSNWNRRTYAMKKFVDFSETGKKLDEKIEQYIENRIINSYNVNRFDGKAKFIITQLFKAYYENPKQMKKSQLNELSKLINYNLENYYDLKFNDGTKVKNIKFDSKDPEFILNLENVSRLIKLLKLEIKIEDLNPDLKLDLSFLKEIGGSMAEISKSWGYVDQEAFKILIFDEILRKINIMEKSNIMKEEDKKKREKILFIKCLIENHYSYLSVICNYIAGMTDNYAKTEYQNLYLE